MFITLENNAHERYERHEKKLGAKCMATDAQAQENFT